MSFESLQICSHFVKWCVICKINDDLVCVPLSADVSTETKQLGQNTVGGILRAGGRAAALC